VLVRGLLECLAGTRSPQQLQRWTTPAVHAELVDLAGTGRSVTGHGRVHVSMPRPGVAEVVTVVRRGRRATALALRLEGFHGRWRATVVHFG
jgi:hypothetical protein